MALKIDTNMSATAFHINDGATVFPYAIDAQHAIASHPLEWSASPWSQEDADAARQNLQAQYEEDVADAKARGLPEPAPPAPPPPPLTEADQVALDDYNRTVAEASERLAAYHERKRIEQEEADQVARDELTVSSLPPAPAPVRPNNLSPAQMKKRAAMEAERKAKADKKAAADRKLVQDKANEDKLAGSGAPITS